MTSLSPAPSDSSSSRERTPTSSFADYSPERDAGRGADGEEEEEDEEDEGEDGYRVGGYHRVHVGDVFGTDSSWLVEEKLGWGHFSTVWLVRDASSGTRGALKVQKSAQHYIDAAEDEWQILKACREAARDSTKSGSCLISNVFESFTHVGPHGAHPCTVGEVLGDNLLTLMDHWETGVPYALVAQMVWQICSALDFLHNDVGVVHTDLKPENVLVAGLRVDLASKLASTCPALEAMKKARGIHTRVVREEEELRFKIEELRKLLSAATVGNKRRRLKEKMRGLQDRLSTLRTLPSEPSVSSASTTTTTTPNPQAEKREDTEREEESWNVVKKMSGRKHPRAPAEAHPSSTSLWRCRLVEDNAKAKSAFWCANVAPPSAAESLDSSSASSSDGSHAGRGKIRLRERGEAGAASALRIVAGLLLTQEELTRALEGHAPVVDHVFETSGQHLLTFESMGDGTTSFLSIQRALTHTFSPSSAASAAERGKKRKRNESLASRGEESGGPPPRVHFWLIRSDSPGDVELWSELETCLGVRFLVRGEEYPQSLWTHASIGFECLGLAAASLVDPGTRAPWRLRGLAERVRECVPRSSNERAERFLGVPPWSLRGELERDASRFSVVVKIIDLGSACFHDRHVTEEIQTRQYRSPEVLLQSGFGPSADVWSLACMVFELLTNSLLFDPKSESGRHSRDEDHLALIAELVGDPPFPSRVLSRGEKTPRMYDAHGRLRRIPNLTYWGLKDVLIEKYRFKPGFAQATAEFLLPMLHWEPSRRATAKECMASPWLHPSSNAP